MAIAALMLASGCDFLLGRVVRTWSEDVELADGEVITIDRMVVFRESNSWAGDAYSATETRATLSFRDELAALPAWDVPLMPLVLYRDPETEEWVVVATSSRCEVWNARGRPARPYWEFRLRSENWIEVALSPASLGRQTNLLFDYNQELPAEHIALAAKVNLQSDDRIAPKYRAIQQEINERYCR